MSVRSFGLRAVLVLAILAAAALPVFSVTPSAHAAVSFGPLSGNISGPTYVGESQNATYVVQVSGGPAVAANGTQVGIFSYTASVAGTNTTGISFAPNSGSIQNGTVRIGLKVSNISQSLTLYVLVTSNGTGKNQSQNLSYSVNVVVPYRLMATVVAGSTATVSAFVMTVTLDGTPVGTIPVGTLTPGARTPVTFVYVNPNLAPGWHTFAISLAQEHGLVSFVGGGQSVTTTFYVSGPAPNNSIWIVTGIAAFIGVVFIFTTRVAANRRGRAKK